MPKTYLGKWSVGLIIVFFLLFWLFQVLVASGQRGGETFFSNPLLSVPISLAGISGILAFFTGSISVVKNKERSVFVFISIALGLFVLIFVLGEILVPH
ncbi:MAG: hypothetical protein HY776_03985 [Actinobacteria bacterium]|nr:hypothetical protein [Actinomycetota bacterium]